MKAQTNTQSYGAPECFVQNYWNLVTVRPNDDKKIDLEFKLNVLLCTFKACLGTYSFNKIYRWRSEEAAFLVFWQGTQQATAGVVACPTLLDLIKANAATPPPTTTNGRLFRIQREEKEREKWGSEKSAETRERN